MSDSTRRPEETEYEDVSPPIGWSGQTLQQMLRESEQRFDDTGYYQGLEELELKDANPFKYEELFSRLRGSLVSARETALQVSSSPVVRELGELCFQVYTPEGDCIALSTGIIVHVHTGSLAIKYMIREDYELDRGINPGDIFCNNDPDIGNVHTADVHTIVPIFHEDELVGWVDGVTHELEIGAKTRGGTHMHNTSRYEDGFYAICEKIGENDRVYQDWKERAKRGTRTPFYWDLDEKCRLSGCHMIRDAVLDIIEDEGIDTWKTFVREAVEGGRRTLKERVKERTVPGEYRDVAFATLPFADQATDHHLKTDELIHLPQRMTVESNGELSIDFEGTGSPGRHSYNAAVGAMEGGLWVTLTQTLLYDGKVNDGSHFALNTNYPAETIVNPQNTELSYSNPWEVIHAEYNALQKNISRGFFARGFREEVTAGYGESGDSLYGGGTLETDIGTHGTMGSEGQYWPVGTFDVSCNGFGASAIRDGLDWAYAMFNPESDMGDVEKWELSELGAVHLSRQVKPNTAGHGKYRGGSGWEGIRTFVKSRDILMFIYGSGGTVFGTSGLHGGYPHGTGYTVFAKDTDLEERIAAKELYPVGDSPPGTFEEDVDGEITRFESENLLPENFDNYDLLHWDMNGGPGYGDPLERPIERVVEDVEAEIFTPAIAESVYGVVGDLDEDDYEFTLDEEATEGRREAIREERRTESEPFDAFRESECERITADEPDMSDIVREMYVDVFECSPEWADTFRSFWDLPEDFTFSDEGGA